MPDDPSIELEPGRCEPLSSLLVAYRERLERLVDLRLDPRLRSRLDPADVVQEAYALATRRLDGWREGRRVSFYVWLRGLVVQRVIDAHREHLGAQGRDAGRERALEMPAFSAEASALLVARQLVDSTLSPSQRAARDEEAERVRAVVERMKPEDREILALRHFEELSNQDAAAVLGLSESAAAWRYVRAIDRLRQTLGTVPG